MDKKQRTVAVGLSGGVDSAATAYLLKEKGYKVIGLTLKVTSFFDVSDAVAVAKALGIEHHVLEAEALFEKEVIGPFVRDYLEGKTPNPCLYCNQAIKYGWMLDVALSLGADYMALGHYANIEYDQANDLYYLKKASSSRKDQSYNLYMLTQRHLKHLIFPLGDYDEKNKVRALVKDLMPDLSQKKDSQDICFIPSKDHVAFIKERSKEKVEGNFVNLQGEVLGQHSGIFNYTIGQKRKLEVYFDPPKFVVDIKGPSKAVVLGSDEDTYKKGLFIEAINFILPEYQKKTFDGIVKLCQWGYEIPAKVAPCEAGVKVIFLEPQRAPAPGQGVVIYQGDLVIGGGFMSSVF